MAEHPRPDPSRLPGKCPACRQDGTLFVASGGWITCSWIECPNPTAWADAMEHGALPPSMTEIGAKSLANSRRWFPEVHGRGDVASLVHCGLGLTGEAGEVANLVKKIDTGKKTLSEVRDDLAEELSDVFAYLLNLAGLLDVDLATEWERKQAICEQRWGPDRG